MKRTAYNEYRKSAKKTAYRSDLLGLHKGWLAFGVELDSFCERETNPTNSSLSNVGMGSLLSSKLYGVDRSAAVNASCTAGTVCTSPTLSPAGCSNNVAGSCTGCTCPATNDATFVAYRPISGGPNKENFIGFGDDNCGTASLLTRQEKATSTTHDADCDLNVSTYEMGVYGHISGDTYFGVSVNNTGIVSAEVEKTTTVTAADASCA